MKNIKDLNERLLWEAKKEKEEKEEKEEKGKLKGRSKLKATEYRDTFQVYSGSVSGTSNIKVNYEELKKELESQLKSINWTKLNVKKVFEVVTKMIGVTPEDD